MDHLSNSTRRIILSIANVKPRHLQLSTMATPPPSLLGPPELANYTPKPQPTSTDDHQPSLSDPFMKLMVSNFNKTTINKHLIGYTENNSPTYLTSANPCLDFFFHVVPDTPPQSIVERLVSSWGHDPLTTLKLIFNLRGIRGTGKSDKESFHTTAIWLHQQHPKTLSCNLPSVANFGYMKDLPEILYRLLKGSDIRKNENLEYSRFKIARATKNNSGMRCINREERSERRLARAKNALDRYNHDPEFRFLYERVSDFFADCLKADMEILKSGKKGKISLAAKWCPSLYSSYDESTLLCESIARKVFPRDLYPEYDGVEEAHYAYRVRDRLRKEVLVPLRKALQLPEIYMSANEWNILPYNRVASVAMKNYREIFFKHDGERFTMYLKDVKSGKEKIAAGALLPHEIIADMLHGSATPYWMSNGRINKISKCDAEVAELQWKRMVDDLLQMGKLRNCMAICDVSGSMYGIPLDVSVALGLLVSELSDDPWKGKLITFSANPQLQMVEGNTLLEKVLAVSRMEWEMNTNFQRVFDLILKVAVEGKLNEDQMIKRLFVFSDMEFDQALYTPWETDYEAIVRKFTAAGYGNAVPEIVFWNLRYSKATPVLGTQKGVALVSGFSKNMIKLFLKDDGSLTPLAVMEKAISGEEYEKLVVLD